jgi:hypothetical protein
MADETMPEVYQFHAWIRQISPMIWRRLLVRSDSTLAELHDVLQIACGVGRLQTIWQAARPARDERLRIPILDSS